MFRMQGIYIWLATLELDDLKYLAERLEYDPDPWAVGARKLIAHEIAQETRHRNKIFTF